jgi:hypothetical protein
MLVCLFKKDFHFYEQKIPSVLKWNGLWRNMFTVWSLHDIYYDISFKNVPVNTVIVYFKDLTTLSEIIHMYIIKQIKQFSNIEEYVKYVLQIFVHIICYR